MCPVESGVVMDYEEADVVVKQVMEQLSGVELDDLLAYADTLDSNHSLRDDPPFTRYEVCGVITRCLIIRTCKKSYNQQCLSKILQSPLTASEVFKISIRLPFG